MTIVVLKGCLHRFTFGKEETIVFDVVVLSDTIGLLDVFSAIDRRFEQKLIVVGRDVHHLAAGIVEAILGCS